MQPVEHDGYFQSILSRAGEGVVPLFIEVTCGGKPPVPAQCHNNVDTFVAENSGFTAVRGWLIDTSVSTLIAHSVLANDDGALFEITCRHSFKFVRHLGEEAEFETIRKKHPGMPYQCRLAEGD
jgi:hypothetical protein